MLDPLVVEITDLFRVCKVVSIYSMILKSTSSTYRPVLAIGPFPTLEHVPMNIENESASIQNVMVGVRNDRVDVHNVVTNVRSNRICVDRKLSLRINS